MRSEKREERSEKIEARSEKRNKKINYSDTWIEPLLISTAKYVLCLFNAVNRKYKMTKYSKDTFFGRTWVIDTFLMEPENADDEITLDLVFVITVSFLFIKERNRLL